MFLKTDPPISRGGVEERQTIMFVRETVNMKYKKDALGAEHGFYEFLKRIGQDNQGFSFYGKSQDMYKGKHVEFRVVSYGGYQASGGWYVYITYRADAINHVRQHVWRWDDSGKAVGYRLNEFIA